MSKVNIKEIHAGDIFGEQSTYRVVKVNPNTVTFTHIKSGKEVELGHTYVEELLYTADQHQTEVTVGLLDKYWTAKQIEEIAKKNPLLVDGVQVGDLKQPGIKTIWSEVGSKPFTVCFEKKGKELSKKAFDTKVAEVTQKALAEIEGASKGKRGVVKTASQVIEELVRNPVVNYEKGEERVLRGVKLQHESPDGFYQVLDLDITQGDNKRLVNLNTIKWLVVGGVKYIVE